MVPYELSEWTLSECLAALGYTTRPGPFGCRHIVRRDEVVFTGNCSETTAWLRATGQVI